MLNQPAEVKREVLSLILGDLDEFKKRVETRETLNLCGKQSTQESATPLSKAISKKVSQKLKESARQDVKATLETVPNLFHLLSESIPEKCIDVEKGLRVREEKWDEWLQICWGHDHDTLSMLSMLQMPRYDESPKQFVEDVEKLPIIQSPVGSEQLKDIVDSHTHSGSLYPPSLQWAHCINTGISVKTFLSNKDNKDKFWCVRDVKSHEEKYQTTYLYLSAARVLLGALLDFYKLMSISPDNISLGNNVDGKILSGLVEKVMKLISLNEDNQATREELQVLIRKNFPELKDNQFKMLETSVKEEIFQDTNQGTDKVYSFLKTERKCIATLLWQAYHDQLGIFLQEVLLTYLRCKGTWFQRNSGKNLETSDLLEYLLFKSYHLSSVTLDTFNKFHSPMSDATKQFYKNSNYLDNKYLKKVEVRLPCMEKMNLDRTINWLCSVYENVNWVLVLSFPRYSYEKQERKIEYLKECYLEFINTILGDNRVNDRVCGIDLVGINQSVHWKDYANLIKDLREHIEKEKKKNCFITYHFSEDMKEISLNEICELWTVLNEAELKEDDRISHGLGLLSPTIKMTAGKTTMNQTAWDLIRDSFEKFTDTLPNKDEIKSLYNQLISSKKTNGEVKVVELDNAVMSQLAASLQPFVKKKLITEKILLEICPTSSWCIAGTLLPTQHPVKSWIEANGKVLIGTDNPAVFPCTIESEYYSLQRLMEQSNMPEGTSHLSSNSEPRYQHDVFISHASEDKDKFVRPLAEKLRDRNYRVWYDEFSLKLGDSLRRSIDKGLANTRYGIVVLSPNFLEKEWPQQELNGLAAREIQGQKVILPIWHDVSRENIISYSPILADRLAVNSSQGLDVVVNKIVEVLGQPDERLERISTEEYIQQTFYPSTNELSREGSSGQESSACSCVDKLAQMDNRALMALMNNRLDRVEVGIIWFLTLDTKMDDTMSGRSQKECVIDLLDKAKRNRQIKDKLFEILCTEHPDIANS